MPKKLLKSLKAKIFYLYILGILFFALFITVSYITFKDLSDIIVKSEKGALLVEYILEVRRYEKNFLLYHKREDFESLKNYLKNTREIIDQCRMCFIQLIGRKNFETFEKTLENYEGLIKKLEKEDSFSKESLLQALRNQGKILTDYAEYLNKIREKIILNSIKELKSWLFILGILFIVLVLFYGYYLYISITKPLKKLENYIFQIIQGKFCAIPPDFEDREMILLVEAINKMLAELDRRKEYLIQTERLATFGTLLFSLAHELNNPLNNISTSCQILLEELEKDDLEFKKELLIEMEKEIERTQKIIRSILDYSKPGEKEKINLKKLLDETLYLLKGKIPSKVEVKLEIPGDFYVYSDPQQLKQVFINLFKNSFDAMSEKGGIIEIKGIEEKDKTVIIFSDTGPGIPAKILPHIFDPFFTTKGNKGYGLGLFIVYNLIKNNQGSIKVESEVDKGTTFIIELPKKEGEVSNEGKSA
ncbi:MAG: HAMP domain-containing sensor histidine kinase [Caldimicrobium sp.]